MVAAYLIYSLALLKHTYLARGLTMIKKVVPLV